MNRNSSKSVTIGILVCASALAHAQSKPHEATELESIHLYQELDSPFVDRADRAADLVIKQRAAKEKALASELSRYFQNGGRIEGLSVLLIRLSESKAEAALPHLFGHIDFHVDYDFSFEKRDFVLGEPLSAYPMLKALRNYGERVAVPALAFLSAATEQEVSDKQIRLFAYLLVNAYADVDRNGRIARLAILRAKHSAEASGASGAANLKRLYAAMQEM